MACGPSLTLLLYSAGLLLVTVSSQTTLTLEAEPGDNVTIRCNHTLEEPAHVFWFKHTNTSVPDLLTCLYYKLYSSPSTCDFIPQSNRTVMSVNSERVSLNITGVNFTDSGLYYCCIQRNIYMTFSTATFLLVQDQKDLQFKQSSRASCCSEVFFMLTVVFSAVIVVLVGALLLILKTRKQCRDDAGSPVTEENKEREGDLVNYAAPQFTNKKVKRSAGRSEDPHVVYSLVRH